MQLYVLYLKMDDVAKTDNALRFIEDMVCDRCGKFGAFRFDGIALCEECYEGVGSCCLEFGGDDLWLAREEEEQSPVSSGLPNEPPTTFKD